MLDIRVWDVGHGLSVRIRTPNGQNHIIDAGKSDEFSPAEHIRRYYWSSDDRLDYLVLSHFDKDHVEGLPDILEWLEKPRVYLRNKTVPETKRYGSLDSEYQKKLQFMDKSFTRTISWDESPNNPSYNGGVDIISEYISWENSGENFNNASIVMSYCYANCMIVFPGDIEPNGWATLRKQKGDFLRSHLEISQTKILVAPHHGRSSGYSQEMIDYLAPHLIVASDGYGAGETDQRFYKAGLGINFGLEEKSFVSTKSGTRKMIQFHSNGTIQLDG